MPATTLRGRFVWHELMTTDPDAAARFYPLITGWRVQTWEHDPSYRMWAMKGVHMGGLMRLPEDARRMGAPPSWLMYVGTPDVDVTVRDATARGARTFVAPQDLPIGRFAVLADPQGATFALYQPAHPTPGSDEAGLGGFGWHELATTDWRAAWDFYQGLFGWEQTEAMDMGPAGTYQMFGRGGRSLGGMYNKPAARPGPPSWLLYIEVPNADRAADAVRRAGGTVLDGPMDVPGGRIAPCVDPQGAAFAVHSVVAKQAAPKKKPSAKRKKKMSKRPKAKPKKRVRKTRGTQGRRGRK